MVLETEIGQVPIESNLKQFLVVLSVSLGVATVMRYKSVGYVAMSFQVQGREASSARCAAVVPKHECCQIQLK